MIEDIVEHADPSAVWDEVREGSNALVIDVRTRPEWTFVGLPALPEGRLALIEWQTYPTMEVADDFAHRALSAIDAVGAEAVFFLCRSGVRSLHAALAVKAAAQSSARDLRCVNVSGGFEGDPSPSGQRGQVNGWKALGLPWRQS
ncbi:MAG: rhodanese-like domain-containing protein [Pseudomonadota bacterium]